jgi:hypothetical protein
MHHPIISKSLVTLFHVKNRWNALNIEHAFSLLLFTVTGAGHSAPRSSCPAFRLYLAN